MNWQQYTAISVLTLSMSIVLQRVLIKKDKVNPAAYAVVFQGLVGLVLFVAVLFHGFNLTGIEKVWFPAVTSTLLYGAGHIIYAKALQHVEASVFAILFATQAVWIMLAGIILLHEQLTGMQLVGSVLIFASITLLVKRPSLHRFDKGVLLALLAGLVFGLAITGWSYVGRHIDGLSWAATSFVGTSLAALLFAPRALSYARPLLQGSAFIRLAVLSLFYAVGCAAMLYAYKLGSLAIVSPLRQTGIILTVLIAFVFLKAERTNVWKKLLAALVCCAGVMLIVA